MKYNYRESLYGHFNYMRSFVLGDEAALLMASYPEDRPKQPFPYFTEVMTGFEYTAAVGMLYEGLTKEGLTCIADIRDRYDGRKRSPFDEAECGHHYARAMASWAAVLALTGFHYSGVDKSMTLARRGRPALLVQRLRLGHLLDRSRGQTDERRVVGPPRRPDARQVPPDRSRLASLREAVESGRGTDSYVRYCTREVTSTVIESKTHQQQLVSTGIGKIKGLPDAVFTCGPDTGLLLRLCQNGELFEQNAGRGCHGQTAFDCALSTHSPIRRTQPNKFGRATLLTRLE